MSWGHMHLEKLLKEICGYKVQERGTSQTWIGGSKQHRYFTEAVVEEKVLNVVAPEEEMMAEGTEIDRKHSQARGPKEENSQTQTLSAENNNNTSNHPITVSW